ncbi:MAG TPA: enoyl-CoA hydratase/isomerase family protein [Bdellovibrionota bacterium]|nr:enoyl-CoA hydratase/isomerase family protein [Bdellovibrionota bacterium]
MLNWTTKDGICEVAMERPPGNEIGREMLEGFERFLEAFDPEKAKVVILYSKLESGFCAGADLRHLYREMASRPGKDHAPEMKKYLDRIHAVMNRLDSLPAVTIGMIHGVCFGGGFELALTCDLLVAEKTARFCFPELRLGILPGFGGIPRLKRDVGNSLVRDLLLTGRSINAQKAQQVGLVSQVVSVGEGLAAARSMAQQAAKFDPDARATTKEFMKPIPVKELEEEKQHFLRLFQRPQVMEALKKFVESDDLRPYLP